MHGGDSGIDKVDLEARRRAARVIHEKFSRILRDLLESKPPVLEIPKRTLSNVRFDPEKGILVMGEEKIRREFLNMGETRKFMQTLLMAAIIYQALVENEYPTIRDLYYRGKHTIVYRDLRGRRREENTWNEQSESDAAIRDIEVYTGLLREDMLILSKEKGKVVGRMTIRSGGDVIDLSRMGHGAYAIESTPDLIEFLDVDAEFVLVVEKDAVFQQLHRIKFWDKYRALLVTGAGQPDRATRRFVRRLNEELGLPIYILTDSIPEDEVVVVRDMATGLVHVAPIGELLGRHFTPGVSRERIELPIEVPSWNPVTGRVEWTPVGYIYRHYIDDEILEIETQGRGVVRVTKAHSLFVFRDGKIQVIPARDIKPGDHIIVTEKLPDFPETYSHINFKELARKVVGRFKIREAGGDRFLVGESRISIPVELELDEDLAWFIGIYVAEGSTAYTRHLTISLNRDEEDKFKRIISILKEKFDIKPYVFEREDKPEYRIWINSATLYKAFDSLGLIASSREKRIPGVILNATRNVKLAFIKGLIDGDGSIDKYGDIIYASRSETLVKQLFLLLLSLGVNPSVTINGDDYIIRIGKSNARTPPEIYEYLTGRPVESRLKGLPTDPTYSLPINDSLKKLLIKLMNSRRISYKPTQKRISKAKLVLVREASGYLPDDYALVVSSDISVVRVRSVRTVGYKGYVYDFAVPTSNTFIGNFGILYHNSDPYGWYIYSVFKVGSIQLSYESERLATPRARFLGVSMSDVFGYRGKRPYLSERERRNFIIRAKDVDLRRARELMRYSWFRSRGWRRELKMFLEKKAKLEIEAMASKGLRFLADVYIPEKLQTGDWLE